MDSNLRNDVTTKLVHAFFKVVLRVGVNNNGVLIGEVPSYMPPSAFVCEKRTETTYTIHLRHLAAGSHLRPTLRRLYHSQLHRVSAK